MPCPTEQVHARPGDPEGLEGQFGKDVSSVATTLVSFVVFNTREFLVLMSLLEKFFADDHSRVILSHVDGIPCSDYINASYIDVSLPPTRATLAPGLLGVECGS